VSGTPPTRESEEQEEAAKAAVARAREWGIHTLAIPTPFQVGRVNAYLIEGEPLTLVDCGPNSGKALDELELALAALGHSTEEIGLLVITHQHIDHFGLAAVLARRSGAPVAALAGLDRYLSNFREEVEHEDRFAELTMRRHGIPPDVVTALRAVSASFRGWGSTVEVAQPLHDGDELELADRTLRVLHRPGHSPSDTVFLDEQRRVLIAGDHLLAHISSNPIVTRPLSAEGDYTGPRPHALVTYLDSLRKTRAMELDLVLPGHGPALTDHVAVVDSRIRLHARRAERIHGLLSMEALTAYEMASQVWGNIAVTQAYLTLSEVLGHLDILIDEERVRERDDDGVVRFEAT
jgi:glyoxylase-like metal-dependent hydrolase (beta-lactamase superfamily II)